MSYRGRQFELMRIFLDGERHNASELIELTGAKMTTVYGALRGMTCEGWLTEERVPGTSTRNFVVTPVGRRRMRFILELHDDSRSSSPTAARSSS